MKSNEEFIAGIYEKAAAYTEEKETKTVKVNRAMRVTRIAAMFAVCLGLAGVLAMTFGGKSGTPETPGNPGGDYGIALLSEDGTDSEGTVMQYRMNPVAESGTFTGIVESVKEEECILWLQLVFEENAPEEAMENSLIAVKWDVAEKMNTEISEGTKLMVSGALGTYDNEESERFGSTELVLNDLANLWIWIEETNTYQNLNDK